LPSLLRTSCSLLKVSSKLQECIDPSLHDKISIKITTLLKAICGPTTLDYDALNANPKVVDRAIVNTAPLKIYFQNISGMRTKAEQVYLATSQCEFGVIVLVQTWLNINFYSNEFYDSNLYHVFRKDRDSTKTHCARGGVVIVAVRCNLRCLPIGLLIEDTPLDQVAVSIIGESETLQIVESYIQPNGSYKLYKACLENITDVYNNLQGHQLSCVIGDFNLSSLLWS